MGKQSARLYYQGNDHKDIIFRKQYHDKMYKGSSLVWEKIFPDGDYFLSNVFSQYSDISIEHSEYLYGRNSDFVRVYPKTKEVCLENICRRKHTINSGGFQNTSLKYFFTFSGMISKDGKHFFNGELCRGVNASNRQLDFWIGDDFHIPFAVSQGWMTKISEREETIVTTKYTLDSSNNDYSEIRDVYGYGTNYLFIIKGFDPDDKLYYKKVKRIDKTGHVEEIQVDLPGYKPYIGAIVNCGTTLYIQSVSKVSDDSKKSVYIWYKSNESLSELLEITRSYLTPASNPVKLGNPSIYFPGELMIFADDTITFRTVNSIIVNITNRENQKLFINTGIEQSGVYCLSFGELLSNIDGAKRYFPSNCAAYVKNGKIDNNNPPGIVFDTFKQYTKEDNTKVYARIVIYIDNFYFEESSGNFAYIVEEIEEQEE